MSFLDHLTDLKPLNKKRKLSSDMPFFAQPQVRSQRHHDQLQPSHNADDISSDLELSFASNVSLNSPPRDAIVLTPESEYPTPMDISPAPPIRPFMRPRAFTSGPRMFGQDRSNDSIHAGPPSSLKPGSTHSNGKRTQRSALPSEWFTTAAPPADQHPSMFSAVRLISSGPKQMRLTCC
jgi:M-phase inducer tyrosine phosphatase